MRTLVKLYGRSFCFSPTSVQLPTAMMKQNSKTYPELPVLIIMKALKVYSAKVRLSVKLKHNLI